MNGHEPCTPLFTRIVTGPFSLTMYRHHFTDSQLESERKVSERTPKQVQLKVNASLRLRRIQYRRGSDVFRGATTEPFCLDKTTHSNEPRHLSHFNFKLQ